LEQANKSFSRKPVVQLEAIPELEVLISISDSIVSVHALPSLKPIEQLQKTRGATVFAADVQVRRVTLKFFF